MRGISHTCKEVAAGAPFALWVAGIAFIALTADRGCDFWDEGFYLQTARYPADVEAWPTAAHRYAAWLYWAMAGNLVALRLCGLTLLAASSWIFAHGVACFVEHSARASGRARGIGERLGFIGFCGLGTFLFYHFFLRVPSYNLFNAAALNASIGLAFASLVAGDEGRQRTALAGFFAAGAIVGLCFFAKFSTAVMLLALIATGALTWPGRRRARFAALACGVAAWAIVHFGVAQRPGEWWSMTRDGLAYISDASPVSIGEQFQIYAVSLFQIAQLTYGFFGLPLAAYSVASGLLSLRPEASRVKFAPILLAATCVWFAWISWRVGLQTHSQNLEIELCAFYLGWVILLNLGLSVEWLARRGEFTLRSRRVATLAVTALVLALLPFVGALGTSNPLGHNLLLHAAPLFALLALLFRLIEELQPRRGFAVFGSVLIAGFAFSQLLSFGSERLYRHRSNVWNQSVATTLGEPSTAVRLEPLAAHFVSILQEAAQTVGFRPGDDLLTLFDFPGISLALGARSPIVPWYIGPRVGPTYLKANAKILERIPRKRLRRALIAVTHPMEAELLLATVGIVLQRDFVLLVRVETSDGEEPVWLWAPRDRIADSGS